MPDTSDHLHLVPNRPDAEVASELKQEFLEALGPVLVILNRAKKEGFDITFQLVCNNLGQSQVQMLRVTKDF